MTTVAIQAFSLFEQILQIPGTRQEQQKWVEVRTFWFLKDQVWFIQSLMLIE